MLGKATAFVAAFSILFLIAFLHRSVGVNQKFVPKLLSALWITSPLAVGGLLAYFLFLYGSDSGLAIEPTLIFAQDSSVATYLTQLLPLGAYFFSLLILIAPTIALLKTSERKNPLVASSLIVGILALFMAVVLQLPASNEAWLFTGTLAIILPLSALFVWRWMLTFAESRKTSVKIWIWFYSTAIFLALILVSTRESLFFLLRPWATPAMVLIIVLLSALAVYAILKIANLGSVQTLKIKTYLTAAIVSVLFLTSITFGLSLRVTGAGTALEGRNNISQQRDQWLFGAQELISTSPFLPDTKTVAIYSISDAEETLVRWIPFFAEKPIYNFRSDDFIQNIFLKPTPDEMEIREKTVREYVETRSNPACRRLEADGVRQIWLTPNFIFNEEANIPQPVHALMDVDCDF
jgi:hypothetical protein